MKMDTIKLMKKCKVQKLFLALIVISGIAVPAQSQQSWMGKLLSERTNQEEVKSFYDITVSLHVQDAALNEIFNELENQMGLRFLYNLEAIENSANRIDLNYTDAILADVLKDVAAQTGLTFRQINNTVSVGVDKLREPALETTEAEFQISIRGTVFDGQTGEALPGVNVIAHDPSNEATPIGTTTNIDGEYLLTVPDHIETIIFSYVGYQRLEIDINDRTEIDIELLQEAITGDEVVVVGYGQQRKRDITGSIASVNFEDFANEPSQQIAQSLKGRVAGVQIMQDSGNPGSSLMMRVRGISSVNSSASGPLYVIDGNPMADPSDIDPASIENIQILKSASAAAIYGARGSSGVVLITTRKGRPGSPQLDVNFYEGVQYARRMPMTNASEYATLYNEAVINAGQSPIFENPDAFGKGTDWQEEILRPASIRDLQVSVGGGNDRSTYMLSGSMFMQDGVVKSSSYDRLSMRLNSSHRINEYLQLGQNLSLSRAEFSQINPYGMGGILNSALNADPTVPVKNPDGSWGVLPRGGNLAASMERQFGGTVRPVLNGDVHAIITPIENLTFRTQYNMTYGTNRSSNFNPEYYIGPSDQNITSSISRGFNSWNNWNWENTLSYVHNSGVHNFDAMIGFTAQENKSENFNGSAEHLPRNADIFPGLRYFGLADSGQNVDGSGTAYGMVSYLGRINYNYDETYLITLNYRVDGSSRFGSNNRYGYFPSFSLGWRLSNESFLENINFINDLMVRGGWGELGNQSSLSDYAFTSSVTTELDYYFGEDKVLYHGQAPTGMGNPDLQWESLKETNIGIDFTGFRNRVNITLDYYHRTTSNMLVQIPMIAYSGIQDPAFSNAGEVVNKGLEIDVGYQRTTPGNFYYNISGNISFNNNEVTALAQGTSEILGGWISFVGENYTTRAVVGQPLGVFYGYQTDGIFQNQAEVDAHATQPNAATEDLRFKDLNGDGVINSQDQDYNGSPWPTHTFGLNFDFAYRNFDLNIGLQGVYGNKIFSAWKWYNYGPNWFNYHKDALNRWTGEGTSQTMPRLNINDPNSNLRSSDWYVDDGSYLRLNNLQIGYTISQSVIDIRRLRVYAVATNLFTITGYPGVDPELGTDNSQLFCGIDTGHYPLPRTSAFGINIGL